MRAVRHFAESLGAFSLLGMFRILPMDYASSFGGWLGRRIGPCFRGRTRRAARNVARTMPDLSPREVDGVISRMWENLGRVLAEYAHLDNLFSVRELDRVEMSGVESWHAARARGNGVVLISGHFANWEIMPLIFRRHGIDGGFVYRPVSNRIVDAWLLRLRQRIGGVRQFPKRRESGPMLFRFIHGGGSVGFLMDQKMNNGIEARLFGFPAMTADVPARLALRCGAPIIPVSVRREEGVRFKLTFHPEIPVRPTGDTPADVLTVTQALNDFLEDQIRARPGEWLWLHNRWPRED